MVTRACIGFILSLLYDRQIICGVFYCSLTGRARYAEQTRATPPGITPQLVLPPALLQQSNSGRSY